MGLIEPQKPPHGESWNCNLLRDNLFDFPWWTILQTQIRRQRVAIFGEGGDFRSSWKKRYYADRRDVLMKDNLLLLWPLSLAFLWDEKPNYDGVGNLQGSKQSDGSPQNRVNSSFRVNNCLPVVLPSIQFVWDVIRYLRFFEVMKMMKWLCLCCWLRLFCCQSIQSSRSPKIK
jgi:hypothetical protein